MAGHTDRPRHDQDPAHEAVQHHTQQACAAAGTADCEHCQPCGAGSTVFQQ